MTNLTELLTLWIWEEIKTQNEQKRRLKSKIPDFVEKIEKLTLKGERMRIIEMIRSEERRKVIEDILKL